jgi:hypothetical protein
MLLELQVKSPLMKNLMDWIFETAPERSLLYTHRHLEMSCQMMMKSWSLLILEDDQNFIPHE